MAAKFNPDSDIPSLAGKAILVTGGTAGLGAGSVKELAKHGPSQLFFSGRNQKSADALIKEVAQTSPEVKATFIKCDISSFAAVREAAAEFKRQSDRLDILMLNAGIAAVEPGLSAEGFEKQFATNQMGHALLVKLLLPVLQQTAKRPNSDVRIINLSSTAYQLAPGPGIDFDTLRSKQEFLGNMTTFGHRWARYGQSKLAQLHYSQQLAKYYPEITSVSVHPGFINTGLFGNIPLSTQLPILLISIGRWTPVEEGHYIQCWAATTGKSNLINGEFYDSFGGVTKRRTKQSKDEKLAERLWEWTQKELEAQM